MNIFFDYLNKLSTGKWTLCNVGNVTPKTKIRGDKSYEIKLFFRKEYKDKNNAVRFFIDSLMCDIEFLPILVIGTEYTINLYDKKAPVISQNVDQNRQVTSFNIGESLLKEKPSTLIDILKINPDNLSNEIKTLVTPTNYLPLDLFYSYFYQIRNTDPDTRFDSILIPTSEIFRYFFLPTQKLCEEFIDNTADDNDIAEGSIPNLLYHVSEGRKIIDVDGKKTGHIVVKENLTDDELKVLGRIAFIKNAYSSVTEHFNTRLRIGATLKKGNRIYSLWPQNSSFEISACGEPISIGNNTYFFVHQIYSVLETLPYEKLICGLLKNSGSVANSSENQVTSKPRIISANRPKGDNITVTSQQPGRPNVKTVLPFTIKIIEPLKESSTVEIIKVKTSAQLAKHVKSLLIINETDKFTLSDDTDEKSENAKATIKAENRGSTNNNDPRFKTFKEALLRLTGFKIVYYFYNEEAGMKWQQKFTCNSINNTLLLCVEISLKQTIYLIKLIYNQDTDHTRYCFLFKPNGEAIEDSDIRSVCNALLEKGRLIDNESFKNLNNRFKLFTYIRKNQKKLSAEDLSKKISTEIYPIVMQ